MQLGANQRARNCSYSRPDSSHSIYLIELEYIVFRALGFPVPLDGKGDMFDVFDYTARPEHALRTGSPPIILRYSIKHLPVSNRKENHTFLTEHLSPDSLKLL